MSNNDILISRVKGFLEFNMQIMFTSKKKIYSKKYLVYMKINGCLLQNLISGRSVKIWGK
jgi:hypothetical protein